VRDSNTEVKALLEKIADLTEQLARVDADLNQANADLLALGKLLDSLQQRKQDLEYTCHYVLKNFDDRQQARVDEIDALNSAKAVMSNVA